MKSIVEEASSVAKAIEKGWIQAGKPQEFSVKVFETEQKNFLGMTTKSAKIAIYYTDKNSTRHEYQEKRNVYAPQPKKYEQKPSRPTTAPRVNNFDNSLNNTKNTPPVERQERTTKDVWSDEMTTTAQQWLEDTLRLMNLSDRSFTVEAKNYYLKFNFNTPLLEDAERERLLFRSLAHLIMQTLRNKFKKGFRGFKIILNSRP
jgi:predicted RNA-binding protein Jag